MSLLNSILSVMQHYRAESQEDVELVLILLSTSLYILQSVLKQELCKWTKIEIENFPKEWNFYISKMYEYYLTLMEIVLVYSFSSLNKNIVIGLRLVAEVQQIFNQTLDYHNSFYNVLMNEIVNKSNFIQQSLFSEGLNNGDSNVWNISSINSKHGGIIVEESLFLSFYLSSQLFIIHHQYNILFDSVLTMPTDKIPKEVKEMDADILDKVFQLLEQVTFVCIHFFK